MCYSIPHFFSKTFCCICHSRKKQECLNNEHLTSLNYEKVELSTHYWQRKHGPFCFDNCSCHSAVIQPWWTNKSAWPSLSVTKIFFCFKKFMDLGVFFGHLIMPITTSTSLMSRVMIAKGNGHVRFKGLFINDVSPIIYIFALPRPFPSPHVTVETPSTLCFITYRSLWEKMFLIFWSFGSAVTIS